MANIKPDQGISTYPLVKRVGLLLPLLFCTSVHAVSYPLPENPDDSFIGDPNAMYQFTLAKHEDTLLDIARVHDLGQEEIIKINPDVDRWLPGEGASVRLPNNRLLPDAPRIGLVLNLPEFRLYYYPKHKREEPAMLITHPISIGRMDWETPLGNTRIVAKVKDPVWVPPKSIKEEHAANDDPLPDVVPAGEDNPLGAYAMRLGIPGYLIHGTNKPFGVGMRVSHGCIRMYPEDIEKLFAEIRRGTKVAIVNQPIKVGWLNNTLYIEVHPDLNVAKEDAPALYEKRLDLAFQLIEKANNDQVPVVNGRLLREALEQQRGTPVAIFTRHEEMVRQDAVNPKNKKSPK